MEQVSSWGRDLMGMASADVDSLDDAAQLQMLHELEILTRTAAGLSARIQVAFHASQVGAQITAGAAPSRAGRAVPDDLALARMTSPYWGCLLYTSPSPRD